MKKFFSKQRILRVFLLGFGIFIWMIKIPSLVDTKEALFCYTRDEWGNKELIKDNGAVYVEDSFVMEIPKKEWSLTEDTTVTIILEDKNGNQKIKTIKLYEKEPWRNEECIEIIQK